MKKITIMTIIMTIMLFAVPITTNAATYNYNISGNERTLEIVDGETTLTVDEVKYVLTKRLIAADAALDTDGTAWILFKNGTVYWWSYDLEKAESVVTLHKLYIGTTGITAKKLVFSSDEKTVIGYEDFSGKTEELPTLSE